MNKTITRSGGIKLKTAGKTCAEDITLRLNMQDKTATENGVRYTADSGYAGLSSVKVNVPSTKLEVVYRPNGVPTDGDIGKLVLCCEEPEKVTFSTNAEDQMYRYADTSITLPNPIYYRPIAMLGSKMYIFGMSTNYENDICIVDLADNSVLTVTKSLGHNMKESKAVVIGGKIYIFCSTESKILLYDPQTDEITEKLDWASGSSTRMGCVVYDDCVYFIGKESIYNGQDGTYYWYRYNPVSNTIAQMGVIQELYYRWRDCAVTIYNDNLYVFGGERENSSFRAQNTIFKYNFTTKKWTTMTATLPDISSFFKSLTVGSKVYLFGSKQHPKNAYVFDCETETVELLGDIFPYYYNYENVQYGNVFYRVGGGDNDSLKKSIATFKVDFALPHGNVLLYEGNGGVPIGILKGNNDVYIKIQNVYIGNESGRSVLLDAYYHNGTNWVNINTGATL